MWSVQPLEVLLEADFMGNCMVGLKNCMDPSGEREVRASNAVVSVGVPNTNRPSFCTVGVVPVPSLLVCRHLLDNEVAKAFFISPTVILSNSFGS